MAIDGGLRGKLVAGTRLTARYKGIEYGAELVEDEDGGFIYRLEDGRDFRSPSAAGAAVMDGTACNGWRFWSIAETSAPKRRPAAKRGSAAQGAR
jgi:hypothetical protein